LLLSARNRAWLLKGSAQPTESAQKAIRMHSLISASQVQDGVARCLAIGERACAVRVRATSIAILLLSEVAARVDASQMPFACMRARSADSMSRVQASASKPSFAQGRRRVRARSHSMAGMLASDAAQSVTSSAASAVAPA
jgi:hypothetical protein